MIALTLRDIALSWSYKAKREIANALLLLILVVDSTAALAQPAEDYKPSPDSQQQPGVPKGLVQKFTLQNSKIFPGTQHEVSIYVPASYNPTASACVYISQDGIQNNAPVVFDNLIAKHEMPITIGIFITPGILRADTTNALNRFNRSYEYDGVSSDYARFLLEEILPEVENQTTSDGRAIRLSRNGNDRCIGGASSGAICAFTAAWERSDAFARVFSAIGTYVGLRGGEVYPTLIRKFEPKPIRVFLQDGANDLNIYGGDWWMANQMMERALTFAGYEVYHVWGEGGHNGKQATAIFPDAMRWLWKEWPQPIKPGVSKNAYLQELLLPGEDWQLVVGDYRGSEGTTANDKGEVFFNDVPNSKIKKIGLDGKVSEFVVDNKRGDGQAFGPDQRLYAVATAIQKILAYDMNGNSTPIAEEIRGNDLVVRHDGLVYVTEPDGQGRAPGKVWLIKSNGEKQVVDSGLKFPNGITLSPDQSLLYVDDYRSHWVYSYQIQADGSLKHKQRYFDLHVPEGADDSGADGMRCDSEGRLYVTTRMGLQVCDPAGRVECILPTPNGRISNLTFGGENFDILFASCGEQIFKRKLKVKGAQSFLAPIKPVAPRL